MWTEDQCHMLIVLWVIHPRKGASRGVRVKLKRSEIPEALKFIEKASRRNMERFSLSNKMIHQAISTAHKNIKSDMGVRQLELD